MKQYTVTGMSCSACSARIERAVCKVPGVTSCSVSLLTNSMAVEGTASAQEIISAVTAVGYKIAPKEISSQISFISAEEDTVIDHETSILKHRLIVSICFLLVLLYLSMGYMMWGWPLPASLQNNHIAIGLLQLLLTTAIMVINQKFFINGTKGLFHGSPNMDTLVAIGSFAAYAWSIIALFLMTDATVNGNETSAMAYMDEFYFESSAMILTLITVGKLLETYSKGKTTNALKSLMKLAPKNATVLKKGIETIIPIDQVQKGDIFVVRPGENIPVDGLIVEGSSSINEASLTGESIPMDKVPGNKVFAATINQSGFIKCQATRVGQDTTLSQIIKMVSDAATTKAPIAKIADKVSGIFVPVVIAIAIITLIVWLLLGETFAFSLGRSISVLVISCPCALGLATPVAIMVGNGLGAKNGILFKTSIALENIGKIQIVTLDKTGTITRGDPQVTDLIVSSGFTKKELLEFALALEQKSEHPLGKAIVKTAVAEGIQLKKEVSDFRALSGNGVSATLDGELLIGGSMQFIEKAVEIPPVLQEQTEVLTAQGKTPLFFVKNNILIGIIAVGDVIKEDAPQAIQELKNMGIKVVMLTGDNEKTARAIGKQIEIDQIIANVLPIEKESMIRKMKKIGKIAMVGDGINDAPALVCSDLGIAIGAGTDVAIDAADIVLMKSQLSDVSAAIRLGRKTLKNIYENLFWAFFYNCIGIPLAAGVFIPLFGWDMNPIFAATAMSLSSICVVANALRLNFFNLRNSKHDKHIRQEISLSNFSVEEIKKEENSITICIEGMMCTHCETAIIKALESLPEIVRATANHETGTASVLLNGKINKKTINSVIKKAGYKVLSIQ